MSELRHLLVKGSRTHGVHPGEMAADPGAPPCWRIDPAANGSGIALTGEFDLVNRRDLETALGRLVPDGESGDVDIDMSGVTFIDLGAVTALALAAQALPQGRRIVLHEAPRTVRMLLDVCWPELDRIEGTAWREWGSKARS